MIARAGAVAAVVACAGCILFVDSGSSGFSTTCGIASADTTCGQCITSSCQPAIDACCADGACSASLGAVDSCAGGDCSSFEAVYAPAFSPLADCIERACADACPFTLPPASTCTVDGNSGVVCGCSIPQSGSGNLIICRPPSNGLCCADEGWPAGTTSCECISPICSTYSNACVCETATQNDPSFFVQKCTSAHCCEKFDGSCWCSTDACETGDIEVDECTPDLVTCGQSQSRVPRCSK